MKNILLTILALFTALPLIAQEPTGVDDKIYRFVEEQAEPKEGMEKFREDFIEQLDLSSVPVELEKITIKIRFTVEKDGSFSNIRMMENEYGLEDNAIEVLKNMPPWNPAKHEGEIVRSVYTISMVVKIQVTVEEEMHDVIYDYVHQKAEPKEGDLAFRLGFSRRFRMPDGIPSDVKQLSVRLKFVIEKDGTLSNIQALSNDYGVGDEGVRVLKTMPKWRPAKYDDMAVRSTYVWRLTIAVNINQ